MNINQTKELQQIIYNIYYNGEDPIKFYEFTGLEDYMEQLYPSDTTKLVGDWISERYNVKNFLKLNELNEEIKKLSELYQKTRFYCNIPTGKALEQFIRELDEYAKEPNTPER